MAQPIAIRRASIYRQRARQLAEAYAGRHPMGGQRWRARTQDALSPDVILSSGVTGLTALQKIHHIPVVFAVAPDPVGAGFVDSLARPGGNVTGFMQYLTAPILKTSSGARPATSIAFSRAKSRRISRCRRQPSTSW
ncbi:MAG: ABC transporter substrate binding protein [Pseudolabrys sp.]